LGGHKPSSELTSIEGVIEARLYQAGAGNVEFLGQLIFALVGRISEDAGGIRALLSFEPKR
jgi:hypothetical protein